MRSHSRTPARRFVLCIRNDGYEVDLEPRKVYVAVPDAKAAKLKMIRVIDESGEDYLFPKEYFVPVHVTEAARSIFAAGA